MQQKEFEVIYRQVLPQATGVLNQVIENTGLSTLNFHGIRYKGTIMGDQSEAGPAYISGQITLMCIPNDQIAIPTLLTENDLNDSNSFIIATEPYQLVNTNTASLGAPFCKDFEIVPKTSRSCMRGGKIVGQVTNNGTALDVVVTAQLSSFETFK